MEENRKRTRRKSQTRPVAPLMSELELSRLGGGQFAYIKVLSSDQARQLFPAIEDLPTGQTLFALNAADGSPIALTDSHQAAIGHAHEGDLEVASVH